MRVHSFAGRVARLKLAVVALLVLAAPTVGDIGSCGQEATELDAVKFFSEKRFIDCKQCGDCQIDTEACESACTDTGTQTEFDADCFPLVHDGEVCLNALRAADCDDYEQFMADVAPSVPTECNFCPLEDEPQ